MNFKTLTITTFAKFILGGDIFDKIRHIVTVYQQSNLTSEQKRAQAIKDIKDVGLELSSCAVNLGIELSVMLLKSQIK